MTERHPAVPRVYDDFDDGDTRLDPGILLGAVPAAGTRRGATALMPAAVAPSSVAAPHARAHAAPPRSAPFAGVAGEVVIRWSAPVPVLAPRRAPAELPWRPTIIELAVGVVAGLVTVLVVGLVAMTVL